MTISASYSPLTYSGNGSTKTFSVTWPFFTGSLVVTLINSSGVETVQTITTHYTVSGGTDSNGLPATGSVTMVTAPASGAQLRIARVTPKTQSSAWTDSGAFAAKTLESALDRLTLIGQEGGGNNGTIYDGMPGDVIELVTSGATNYWDAENTILSNVANPVSAQDAVTKSYGDANYGAAAALAAAASATAASSSATNAAASAVLAESYADTFTDIWKGDWTTATGYTKPQFVSNGNSAYVCILNHTSGASTEPGVGGSWTTYWDLVVASGGGDVTAASNFATDNRLVRSDGVTKGVQSSGVTVDDSNNVSGVGALSATTIELGHASDTTLSRVSAGVVAIEGSNILTASAIGSTVQGYDADLAAIAGLTSAADALPYFTGSGTASTTTLTSFARSILDDADEATFKATVNLEPGVDVQAYDADLAAIAGLTSAADALPYFTGSGTAATTTLTSYMRTVLDDVDEAAFKATVNLEPGVDVQAYDATLQSLANMSSSGIMVQTGADTHTTRSLVQGPGITISDGSGLVANPSIALDINGLTTRTSFSSGDKIPIFQNGVGIRKIDYDDLAIAIGAGLSAAYTSAYDGTTTATASGADTLKFRAGTGLSVAVGSNDVTHGDNVLYSLDSDLSSWAGVTRAAGYDTFAATPSSANLRALLTDETGSGSAVFGTSPSFTTDIRPATHDGTSIGTAALGFSDLFLGTGAVVTWGAASTPDVTLTHSTDTLTLTGGSLVVPATGLTVGSSTPFSDSSGTLTLQNVDALDATTESTIESAIDTLANLTSVQGLTVTLADAGADAIFGWDDSAGAYENLTASEVATAIGMNVVEPENSVINGAFDFWQRGTSSSTAGYQTADRWNNALIGGTCTMSRQSFTVGDTLGKNCPTYFLRHAISGHSLASHYSRATQKIESVRTYAGQTVTVLGWARRSSGTGNMAVQFWQDFGTGGSPSALVITSGQTVTLTGSWAPFACTFSLASITGKTLGTDGNDNLSLHFWTSAGSDQNGNTNSLGLQTINVDLWGIHIRAGTHTTAATDAYIAPGFGDEFERCQRYYQQLYAYVRSGYQAAGQADQVTITLPVVMRATPTAAKVGTWTVNNCSQPTINIGTSSYVYASTTVTALGAFSYFPNDTGDIFTFDAEL